MAVRLQLTQTVQKTSISRASFAVVRRCTCQEILPASDMNHGRRLMSYVGISDYFLISKMGRLPNPARKAVYQHSSVYDRVELWNCCQRERVREQLRSPCKSWCNLLAAEESGRLWILHGSATSLLYQDGESNQREHSFSGRPVFRKHAGQLSNACVVRV
jgi:hypothetical protein